MSRKHRAKQKGPSAAAAASAEVPERRRGAAFDFYRFTPLIAALLTATVFRPLLGGGWTTWDDPANILNNRGLRARGWDLLRWIFSGSFGYMGNYEPLTWLASALVFKASGLEPFGYHVLGLALHACSAGLFCLLAQRLLRLAAPDEEARPAWAVPAAALAAALLFSLHPLRVEVAAWVSGQHHAMAAVFVLLSTLAYLKAAAGRSLNWSAASWACYALSLLCIPIGISLPAALVVLDFYPLRRAQKGPAALFWEKLPYFLIALGAAWIASSARRAVGDTQALAGRGSGSRVLEGAYAVFFYLRHMAWPLGLSPLYDRPAAAASLGAATLGALAGLAAITALLWAWRRRLPAALAAWAAFLILLAPSLSLSEKFEQFSADRYTYLPAMGLSLLAGSVLLWAARGSRPLWARCGAPAAAAALAAGLAAFSVRQIAVWRDAVSVWEHVLALDPNLSTAHNNLGGQLSFMGKKEEAAEHFRAAVRIEPNFIEAWNNLGETSSELGRAKEAMQAYEAALKIDPKNAKTRLDLGVELRRQGRLAESEGSFREAVRLDPSSGEARAGLGATLAQGRRFAEAEAEFRQALALNPRNARAEFYWGNALLMQGRAAEARKRYEAALAISPQFADAHVNLAELLMRQGRAAEASDHYDAALQSSPGRLDLLYKLAAADARAGNLEEAARIYSDILKSRPGDPRAGAGLAAIRARPRK